MCEIFSSQTDLLSSWYAAIHMIHAFSGPFSYKHVFIAKNYLAMYINSLGC